MSVAKEFRLGEPQDMVALERSFRLWVALTVVALVVFSVACVCAMVAANFVELPAAYLNTVSGKLTPIYPRS